jgi:hypothetical protein
LTLAVQNLYSMNHFISLATAVDMTTRFRDHRENVLKTEYQGQNVLAFSETFDKAAFDVLLGKSEATALRIYYGMDEYLKIHAIIVAVDANNEDILPTAPAAATVDEDIIDNGNRCPDLCPPQSPLNG